MNRRQALERFALIAGGCLASNFAQAALKGANLHVSPAQSVLQPGQRKLVEQLTELVIPATDTPGAIEAGVPAFVDQIVSHWYTPGERDIFLQGLARLDNYCQHQWGRPFVSCDTTQQTQALTAEDESSRSYHETSQRHAQDAPDEHSPFFYKLKWLTVLGYYTSEVGATQELSYNPIPGHYEGDIDFDKVGRQWSS
jgi:hypothetical protein